MKPNSARVNAKAKASLPHLNSVLRVGHGLLPPIFLFIRMIAWCFCRLKPARALWLSERITPLFLKSTRKRRLSNLKAFFGPSGWKEKEFRQFDAGHSRYLARLGVEILRGWVVTPDEICRKSDLHGIDHLQSALARGRGVMLTSGHQGTWWSIPAILAAKGYKVTAVFAPVPLKSIERYLIRLASRFNVRLAFVGKDAYDAALKAIEKNEVFYLAFDAPSGPSKTAWLPLGPAQMRINLGPAMLALRHQMPVVQALCLQKETSGCRTDFVTVSTSPQTTPEELAGAWLSNMEPSILEAPVQWWSWNEASIRPMPVPATAQAG